MKYVDTNYTVQSGTVTTSSSQNVNFPVSNLVNPFRSKVWRTMGCTSEWVTWDFATAVQIDTCCLFWSKENGPKLTSGATITLQGNATSVWTSPAFSTTLTINNTYSVAAWFATTAQTYRYWRVTIADPLNPFGYIELGVAFLGASLTLPNTSNGFKYTLTDLSNVVSTAYGHKYIDQYPLQAQLSFSYPNIDDATISVLENSYRLKGCRVPVLFAVDPAGSVYTKEHFIIYGTYVTPYGNTQQISNIFSTDSLTLVELS